jgi:hypothetical protein
MEQSGETHRAHVAELAVCGPSSRTHHRHRGKAAGNLSLLKFVALEGVAWELRHLREKLIESGFPHHGGI